MPLTSTMASYALLFSFHFEFFLFNSWHAPNHIINPTLLILIQQDSLTLVYGRHSLIITFILKFDFFNQHVKHH